MNFRISVTSIIIVMTYITSFLSTSYIPYYQQIKYACLLAVGIFLFLKSPVVMKGKYLRLNILVIIFSLAVVLVSGLSQNLVSTRNVFLSSIVFSTSFMEIFFLMEYLIEQNRVEKALEIYYKLTLLCVLVTDVLIFLYPALAKKFDSNYFVGTKFSVEYFHIYLIMFYMAFNRNKRSSDIITRLTMVFYIILTMYIGVKVDCNTGIIGIVLLMLFYLFAHKFEVILYSPNVFVIVLLVSCCFLFFYEWVLNNQTVQYYLVNVLHRDLSLTGRTIIYSQLPATLRKCWLLGYGYGSSYEVCVKLFGFSDTQNGLAEWVLQIGFPSTILFLAIMWYVLRKMNKSKKLYMRIKPILLGVYVFAVLASVEITITLRYFVCFALMYALLLNKSETEELCNNRNTVSEI